MAAVYVAGHLVGSATGVVERQLPSLPAVLLNLSQSGEASSAQPRFFRRYKKALPPAMIERIKRAADLRDLDLDNDEIEDRATVLRNIALPIVHNSSGNSAQVHRAGLLMDFCRNLSGGFALASVVLGAGVLWQPELGMAMAAPGAALVAAALWYRYLHFRRRYYVTLLAGFAEGVLGTRQSPVQES